MEILVDGNRNRMRKLWSNGVILRLTVEMIGKKSGNGGKYGQDSRPNYVLGGRARNNSSIICSGIIVVEHFRKGIWFAQETNYRGWKKVMAEDDERVKLFVGQVPKHTTESEILALFGEFAVVNEVNIIKDKVTRAPRGCCFVICPSREEADKVVEACHNKKTLPGASSPLQVKYADGELERLEHKLFVGMLPKYVAEDEVSALFSEYGTIRDLQILRGAQQTSKGCAFLKFETKDQALSAMEALNGKHKMKGSTVPLVVKWADTEKERQARKAQKAMSQASDGQSAEYTQHPSLSSALPMNYMPQYNGYGYQTSGMYRPMSYRLPPVQNQHPFPNMISSMDQRSPIHGVPLDLSSATAQRNYAFLPRYVGTAYAGVQYPVAYAGGIMSNQQPGSSYSAASSSVSSSTPQTEGPPGANLFIYHIPPEFGDDELANAFQRFGRLLSAKVFVDKATGVSKCFGFVSYDSPDAAQNAIDKMNGFRLGGKKLKVQVKRENKQNQTNG